MKIGNFIGVGKIYVLKPEMDQKFNFVISITN